MMQLLVLIEILVSIDTVDLETGYQTGDLNIAFLTIQFQQADATQHSVGLIRIPQTATFEGRAWIQRNGSVNLKNLRQYLISKNFVVSREFWWAHNL